MWKDFESLLLTIGKNPRGIGQNDK